MKRGWASGSGAAAVRRLLLVLIGLSILGAGALATDALRVSPDITASFGGLGLSDEQVGEDDLAGGVTLVGPAGLPFASDLVAYHLEPDGDQLFALDIPASLPGGLVVEPRDVVRWDGADFTLELDGSAVGIPAGVGIDAISRSDGDLLLSFDVTTTLDAVTFADEDVARWVGPHFATFMDGSDAGIPAALDLDGAHWLEAEVVLLVSFDTGGIVGGVTFGDEDVLALDDAFNWSMVYDGSAEHAGWVAADLDAVAQEAPTATPSPTATGMPPPTATTTPTPTLTATLTLTPTPTATTMGGAGTIDVDGDGERQALTDGLLILRYLFGLRGAVLVAGAVDLSDCTRCDADAIEPYIASVLMLLDVDGDGERQALTDGLLILRYLFNLRGAVLIAGTVDLVNCTRCTASAIETYIAGLL